MKLKCKTEYNAKELLTRTHTYNQTVNLIIVNRCADALS